MKRSINIKRICVALGACLLIGAAVMMTLWKCSIDSAEKKAQYYVKTLKGLIPEPQNAVIEERRDNTMSVLNVDGIDFVGIIELPRYGSVLPVGDDWGKSSKYPCRFGGSIYNGTMKIGATTQKGQYDFYRELSVGDTVIFTDAEGNRYTLTVTGLRNEKHANGETLGREDAALTLFIKNIYSFEYLIVFCNVSH
jgi:hypothetical protein